MGLQTVYYKGKQGSILLYRAIIVREAKLLQYGLSMRSNWNQFKS